MPVITEGKCLKFIYTFKLGKRQILIFIYPPIPKPKVSNAPRIKKLINTLCFHIKNDTGSKNSKDSIDTEKRKDSEKSGVRLSTQVS